jgi:hypothetical protein
VPSVFMAVPVNRPLHPITLESMFQNISPHVKHIKTDSAPQTTVDIKRNNCSEAFLDSDCTNILFWDSDTVAPPGAVQKLLDADKSVIGGVVYTKSGYHSPVFGYWDKKRQMFSTPIPFEYNKLRQVDILGTGFMMVKREVFEKLERPWFQCYEKGGNAREDIYFCLKCKEAGIPIYIDTGLHCGHVATPYIITNETYEMFTLWRMVRQFKADGRMERFREILFKELGAKPPILDTPTKAFGLTKAARLLNFKPPDVIQSAYLEYVSDVSNRVWTISWELSSYLCKLIHQLKPKRILDLGSGFSSFVFRWYCPDVTSVDDNPEWLKKTHDFLVKRDVSTKNLMLLKDFIPDGEYDLALMDLGRAERDRAPLFDILKRRCKVAVLDDMHMQPLRSAARKAFTNHQIFDLKVDTFDAYDRYAWMVVM